MRKKTLKVKLNFFKNLKDQSKFFTAQRKLEASFS